MAGPIGSSLDRVFVIIVDPDTGQPVEVDASGAIAVTGTLTVTPTAIVEVTNAQIAIAGSTQILAADPLRKRFMIVNMDTTQTVFLRAGGASATTRFPLYPRVYFDSDNGPFIPQESLFGIEGAGAPTVAVWAFQ